MFCDLWDDGLLNPAIVGRPQEALAKYEESLKLSEHADTLLNMANVEFITNKNVDRAIQLYERALAISEANEEDKAVGEIWFNLGCVCDSAGSMVSSQSDVTGEQLDQAISLWNKSEKAFEAAEKFSIDRADMFRRNVAAKRLKAYTQVNSIKA
jgi:tetratricopeptide (TPR) repeat protein